MMDAEFAAARESIHRSIGQRARWAKTHIAREVSKHLPELEVEAPILFYPWTWRRVADWTSITETS